jgi:hypothetical protein
MVFTIRSRASVMITQLIVGRAARGAQEAGQSWQQEVFGLRREKSIDFRATWTDRGD